LPIDPVWKDHVTRSGRRGIAKERFAMRVFRVLGVFILVAVLAVPVIAASSPVTGNVQVTATVNPSCKWVSAQSIAFNNYDPVDVNSTAPLDAIGSVTLRCAKYGAYFITLGQGLNPATGSTCLAPLRRLKSAGVNPADYLRYDVYWDLERTHVAGCDNSTRTVYSPSTATQDLNVNLYARIPGGQDVWGDYTNYSDTVQVTVTF
jgi:spore coat protein U domain-containing protein, fimbrial subunit CupE1/2/3/6